MPNRIKNQPATNLRTFLAVVFIFLNERPPYLVVE